MVLKELWNELPEEEKKELLSEVEGERTALQNKNDNSRPGNRAENVTWLPETLTRLLRGLSVQTGWSFTVLAGGRHAPGNEVGILILSEGRTLESDLSFQDFHEEWEKQVKLPWVEFINAFVGNEPRYGRYVPKIVTGKHGILCLPKPQPSWTEKNYRNILSGWMEAMREDEHSRDTPFSVSLSAAPSRLLPGLSQQDMRGWSFQLLLNAYTHVQMQLEEMGSDYSFYLTGSTVHNEGAEETLSALDDGVEEDVVSENMPPMSREVPGEYDESQCFTLDDRVSLSGNENEEDMQTDDYSDKGSIHEYETGIPAYPRLEERQASDTLGRFSSKELVVKALSARRNTVDTGRRIGEETFVRLPSAQAKTATTRRMLGGADPVDIDISPRQRRRRERLGEDADLEDPNLNTKKRKLSCAPIKQGYKKEKSKKNMRQPSTSRQNGDGRRAKKV
ncbi:hypothetical protein DACRYDRAFT_22684 [Dacryopinax primogenitus]|uniref:Uncharacterized protein n=1 Tax=Dacryopinax primogenitus (strain DJM 731) TaxID=1858805 RepID=M5G0F7_DACPD|nr:uncharacterized protein DACRYDRAFT_22684 [Dacryopinax primogenitus]EJU01620.1 hypothetical protein DACRYDRAFT_22684 [Dacryopinax primogenitus]